MILISFFASVIGCICGIGGGVIIKPALDAFHIYSVSTISFMSGCIVLSMTAYSVIKERLSHQSLIKRGISTYLGIGASIGGIAGKQLFDLVKSASGNADAVGAVQAAALFIITLGTALYTVNKDKIPSNHLENAIGCGLIGLLLGLVSAFLGIGGGPINLVAFYFCFSMETKEAAQNSLYIILLSQLTSLIFTLISGNIPEFPAALLAVMAASGIAGGIVGRRINQKLDGKTVSRLFLVLLVVIMGICCYNFWHFL